MPKNVFVNFFSGKEVMGLRSFWQFLGNITKSGFVFLGGFFSGVAAMLLIFFVFRGYFIKKIVETLKKNKDMKAIISLINEITGGFSPYSINEEGN